MIMKASKYRTWSVRRTVLVAGLLVLSFVIAAQAVPLQSSVMRSASTSTTYGGEAYGVGVQLPLGGGATYADTGALPASGGFLVADFAPVSDPAADATVFLSYASGLSDVGKSEVATMDVTLLPGNAYQLVASFAYATANADCSSTSGASDIPDLTVGGVVVPVTGAPNQVYSVPGVLQLVINEQIDQSSGTLNAITVNALDLTVFGVAQVIVSSAQSSVDCGSGSLGNGITLPGLSMSPSSAGDVTAQWVVTHDFVTGGGYFFAGPYGPGSTCLGDRVNFGFNAGPRPGNFPTLQGHVNVVDHGGTCPMAHFEGTDVTDYGAIGDTRVCRFAAGDAKMNGQTGFNYMLGVCDYGEPGRHDRFDFQVWTGAPGSAGSTMVYSASNAAAPGTCPPDEPDCGNLPGGNIQLHTFS